MEFKDYYQILNVAKNAGEKEIKRAYRKLARQYHPDHNPDDATAEAKFKEVNEAYEVLGNIENRQKYDRLGANYHRFQQMGGAQNGFDFSQWFSQAPGGAYQVDMNDLFSGQGKFSDFFSAIFGGIRGAQAVRNQSRTATGRDQEHPVTITLAEAYHGTTRTITINNDHITAKIPPGAATGTKIRLRGKGNQGPGGSGDLYLNVQVKPDPIFQREGRHLKTEINVDIITAVLGGATTVPTMTGTVNLTIPAGTQGGRTIRLRGKGMPDLRDRGNPGDLLATIRIRVPAELTATERALYEQLAALQSTGAPQDNPDKDKI
jgi:curved DNA-binding protein